MLDTTTFDASEGLFLELPVLVKAVSRPDGRRVIAVEASNEACDSEGDVVLQKALINSAKSFLNTGHIDIDHLSEIGHRFGITNLSEWIVGVPLEVRDIGKGRTQVTCELQASVPGKVTKADEVWEGLTRSPPVRWRASIYGFPTSPEDFVDVRLQKCQEAPDATRYVVKGLDWRSLALTRNPVNTAIQGAAQVVSMKSFIAKAMTTYGKSEYPTTVGYSDPVPTTNESGIYLPRNRMELLAHNSHHIAKGQCPHSGDSTPMGRSVASFRDHFMKCCKCDYHTADLHSLALMQALKHGS